jgi:gliding motility-associated-like protein
MNPTNVIYTSTGVKLITLEVTTDSCTFSKTYQATVSKASFGAFAQGSSVTCYDDKNGTVNLVPINGQTPYNYKWANGATTASLSNLGPGAYAFTVTDAIGCSCSGEGVVDGPDSIAVAPAVTVETCDGTKDGAVNLTVSGGQAPYSFLWSNGATTEDIGNLEGATYTVTVSDAAKCQKAVDIKVLTVCEGFVFTNLITPNDDGANDAWVVPGILSFPDNELTIFNRYGQVVFSKKGYDNTWRGENSDGNPLPVGAYWFILKLNDAADTVYSGSISILR